MDGITFKSDRVRIIQGWSLSRFKRLKLLEHNCWMDEYNSLSIIVTLSSNTLDMTSGNCCWIRMWNHDSSFQRAITVLS